MKPPVNARILRVLIAAHPVRAGADRRDRLIALFTLAPIRAAARSGEPSNRRDSLNGPILATLLRRSRIKMKSRTTGASRFRKNIRLSALTRAFALATVCGGCATYVRPRLPERRGTNRVRPAIR
jgi:hypothetical protein